MDNQEAKKFLHSILSEIMQSNGLVATDKFSGLREVDAKIREVKVVFREIPGLPQTLLNDFEKDDNFKANSRRVRLETLAYYCQSAIKFLESGVVIEKHKIFRAPDLSGLTKVVPKLEIVIQDRWIEAQKCQHSNCYLSAIILMGSILEALLLSRACLEPITSNKANSSPKDKSGKVKAIQDWNLNSLIDVAVEVGWLKNDRGKFGHALRESRNIVHPWMHASSSTNFDENTCKMCWNVLNASVDDLLSSI